VLFILISVLEPGEVYIEYSRPGEDDVNSVGDEAEIWVDSLAACRPSCLAAGLEVRQCNLQCSPSRPARTVKTLLGAVTGLA
jgi:hypothetical protein